MIGKTSKPQDTKSESTFGWSNVVFIFVPPIFLFFIGSFIGSLVVAPIVGIFITSTIVPSVIGFTLAGINIAKTVYDARESIPGALKEIGDYITDSVPSVIKHSPIFIKVPLVPLYLGASFILTAAEVTTDLGIWVVKGVFNSVVNIGSSSLKAVIKHFSSEPDEQPIHSIENSQKDVLGEGWTKIGNKHIYHNNKSTIGFIKEHATIGNAVVTSVLAVAVATLLGIPTPQFLISINSALSPYYSKFISFTFIGTASNTSIYWAKKLITKSESHDNNTDQSNHEEADNQLISFILENGLVEKTIGAIGGAVAYSYSAEPFTKAVGTAILLLANPDSYKIDISGADSAEPS